MNKDIIKSSIKTNSRFLSILVGTVICMVICIMAIFPSVQANNSYADLLNSMPEGMLDAFGMKGEMSNLNDFLNVNFYNSLYLYIMMAFSIIFSSKLITKHIESTSLVYYLNSKVTRKEYLMSQVSVYYLGLVSIYVSSILSGVLGKVIFASDYNFEYGKFIGINTMIMFVFLCLSSICVLFSCISNTVSQAITWSSVVIGVEYILNMISNISEDFNVLGKLSVFTLIQKDSIMNDSTNFIITIVILAVVSVIVLLVSIVIFKEKDLNL